MSQFLVLAFSLFCIFELPIISAVTICPDPETIAPCECREFQNITNLQCLGTGVNQKTFERLFRVMREVNEVSQDDWLQIDEFQLTMSNLTVVDLTPFMKVSFDSLSFPGFVSLRGFTGPPISTHSGLIKTRHFGLNYNSVTREGLGDILYYFDPSMESLVLMDQFLTSAPFDPNSTIVEVPTPLFPGLEKLVNLKTLSFYNNRIKRISPGSFMTNTRLEKIQLQNNQIVELAENAFVFSENHAELNNITLTIDLAYNELNNSGIPVYHGLNTIQRPVYFDLYSNNIQTVEAEKFQEYLEAPYLNELFLMYCPLVCDSRVKWLKDRRSDLETRVGQANCQNDQGKTIFTSELVN